MDRRGFIAMAGAAVIGGAVTNLNDLEKLATELTSSELTSTELTSSEGNEGALKASPKMPALFVGHGSPMNAIEKNRYSDAWQEIGKNLPVPRAILCISAHWLTKDTRVTAMAKPKTIHDFGGFPKALFDVEYPAPGSPEVAKETQQALQSKHVMLDDEWGFDHGSWSVLKQMFPKADIPVLQLSIDYTLPPAEHLALAQELTKLREKGIMIIGSGNIVHNLRAIDFEGKVYDWAVEFDEWVAKRIESGNHAEIADFQKLGALAKMAHPTYDHFLPLLYTLGVKEKSDTLKFFNTGVDLGSVSMRSVIFA